MNIMGMAVFIYCATPFLKESIFMGKQQIGRLFIEASACSVYEFCYKDAAIVVSRHSLLWYCGDDEERRS